LKPTTIPTISPTEPTIYRNYSYNGKYFSTLANLNVNGLNVLCQDGYIKLPKNWVLAPDNSDSLSAIYYNTWSTNTVVVASGVGYKSKSTYGFMVRTKMLSSKYYSYACAPCSCVVMIMYSPKPSYSPVVYSNSSSSSSSMDLSALYALILLIEFPLFYCYGLIADRRRRLNVQQNQVQPTIQQAVTMSTEEQPIVGVCNDNHHHGVAVMQQPIITYDSNNNMQRHPQPQQQQPYEHPQPGYIQLTPQSASQPQVFGYSHPQVYSSDQQHHHLQPQAYGGSIQPQSPAYGYAQLEPQVLGGYCAQLQPQVYSNGNSSQLQQQPHPQIQVRTYSSCFCWGSSSEIIRLFALVYILFPSRMAAGTIPLGKL
jgi:hypothetical protein